MDYRQKIQNQKPILSNLINTTDNALFQKQSSAELLQKEQQGLKVYQKHFSYLYQQVKQVNPKLSESEWINNLAKAVK